MNLLLDSHVLFWWATGTRDLSERALEAIDAAASVSASLATPWELQIKVKRGKLDLLDADWAALEARGITYVAPTLADVLLAADLPPHHRDPFDRLIIAQALQRQLVVMTRDSVFAPYGVPILTA